MLIVGDDSNHGNFGYNWCCFIMPFMAVLMNPDLIDTNNFLNSIFNILTNFGIKNDQQFFIRPRYNCFYIIIRITFFKALTTYVQTRFTYMRGIQYG